MKKGETREQYDARPGRAIVVGVDLGKPDGDVSAMCIAERTPDGGLSIIHYEEYTPAIAAAHQRWLASLTRQELLEYAEIKMMPTRFMLQAWKAARKAMRPKK